MPRPHRELNNTGSLQQRQHQLGEAFWQLAYPVRAEDDRHLSLGTLVELARLVADLRCDKNSDEARFYRKVPCQCVGKRSPGRLERAPLR